jgi:hypothetical protein
LNQYVSFMSERSQGSKYVRHRTRGEMKQTRHSMNYVGASVLHTSHSSDRLNGREGGDRRRTFSTFHDDEDCCSCRARSLQCCGLCAADMSIGAAAIDSARDGAFETMCGCEGMTCIS